MDPQLIYKGTSVKIRISITDRGSIAEPRDYFDALWPGSGSEKALVDPTTVTIAGIKRGDDTTVPGTPFTMTRVSQGRYSYDFVIDEAGSVPQLWTAKIVATGAYPDVIEVSWQVQATRF